MKNECTKWKSELLEAALAGTTGRDLEEHLRQCTDCAEELAALRAKRERMDALLPLVARGATPATDFRARVLGAAEAAGQASDARVWRAWAFAGVTAIVLVALATGLTLRWRAARSVPAAELAAAQKLAEWQAPSDVLLQSPGRGILGSTPRLGESYLQLPAKMDKEE
jgi:anti-sigma factor RsiW